MTVSEKLDAWMLRCICVGRPGISHQLQQQD
jgi:hypothetical protein